MNFGAGMGAGMGAGIATGIAVGVSSGKQQACQQIRDYVETNAISIHDASGAVVDIGTLLGKAVSNRPTSQVNRGVLAVLLLVGLAALGILAYLAFK